MILLAAALIAGDAWTYDVTLRYEDPEGPLLVDRERWTVRVGKGAALEAERRFVGTLLDGGVLIAGDAKPESAKGKIQDDGTLTVREDWSDPAATSALRRLLVPRPEDERLDGWPVLRRFARRGAETRLPGSGLPASLTVEATLVAARLGGRRILPGAEPG